MPEDTMLMESINAIRRGERAKARDLLTRLIKSNPNNAEYWLWMSAVVSSPRERIYCLQEALKQDPNNTSACRGLVMAGMLSVDGGAKNGAGFIRRNWQVRYTEALPAKPAGPKPSPVRIALPAGALVVLVGIVVLAFMSPRKAPAAVPTRGLPATLKPSATLLPTNTLVVKTSTPTFVGPTPLSIALNITYTPTPLYINTPHPRTEAYKSGLRALERGDYAMVISFMQQLVASESDAVDGYYYMGEAYRNLGKYSEAVNQYNLAIKNNMNFGPAYLGRARARLAQSKSYDPRPDILRALELDPNLGEAYLDLATLAVKSFNAKQALEYLAQAEPFAYGSPTYHLLLAESYLIEEMPVEALENALVANHADRTMLMGYYVLGQAYEANNLYDQARPPLELYMNYDEENPRAWVMLGKSYHFAGELDKALDCYNKALGFNFRQFEALYERGRLYYEQGNYTKAIDDLVTAVRLDDESFPASILKAKTLFYLNFPGDAYMELLHSNLIAEGDIQKMEVYYYEAKSLALIDKLTTSRENWQKLLALDPAVVPPEWRNEAMQALGITPTPVLPVEATFTPAP